MYIKSQFDAIGLCACSFHPAPTAYFSIYNKLVTFKWSHHKFYFPANQDQSLISMDNPFYYHTFIAISYKVYHRRSTKETFSEI